MSREAESRQRRGRGEVEEVRMMGPGIEDSWTEASEEKKKKKKERDDWFRSSLAEKSCRQHRTHRRFGRASTMRRKQGIVERKEREKDGRQSVGVRGSKLWARRVASRCRCETHNGSPPITPIPGSGKFGR